MAIYLYFILYYESVVLQKQVNLVPDEMEVKGVKRKFADGPVLKVHVYFVVQCFPFLEIEIFKSARTFRIRL